MASYRGQQFTKSLLSELWTLLGPSIFVDANGVVLNTNSALTAPLDQYGEPLLLPKGFSVARTGVGLYKLTLDQPWCSLVGLSAEMVYENPTLVKAGKNVAQATVVGTVDLNGLTLADLNGLTLQTDADVGANFTTTFTTPTSIADIAVQINAGNSTTSVLASIYTNPVTLAKYLKVVSTTIGSASTLAINAASTGDGTLGMSNTTATAIATTGALKLYAHNTRGSAVGDIPAQSLYFVHQIAGVATELASAGFNIQLWLKNDNLP